MGSFDVQCVTQYTRQRSVISMKSMIVLGNLLIQLKSLCHRQYPVFNEF